MTSVLQEISNLHLLAVAVGAGLGAVGRAATDRAMVARWGPMRMPLPTLVVNVLGSLLLGIVLGWAAGPPGGIDAAAVDTWRLALGTGFCGGLTTFSTFSFESFLLLHEGRPRTALAYGAATVVLAMLAVVAGDALGSALSG